MRRRGRGRGMSALLFGATGWLFADLFIALTMGFLVANTVGQVVPPRAKPTPTPTAIPTPTQLPTLDLQPVSLHLHVDYQALLQGDPAAIAGAEIQVRAVPQLRGRRAGLVLTFGGTQGVGPAVALQVAKQLDDSVLTDLGNQHYVFTGTVYREFINLDNGPDDIQVDVYVFKQ